uniref:Coat protein n=1 Tax=Rodentolepis nana TaxID=102285 RepID=A0A0R3TVD6_RODNA
LALSSKSWFRGSVAMIKLGGGRFTKRLARRDLFRWFSTGGSSDNLDRRYLARCSITFSHGKYAISMEVHSDALRRTRKASAFVTFRRLSELMRVI